MPFHRLITALMGCLALISVSLTPVLAQQAHNPPGDNPESPATPGAAVATSGWQVANVTPLAIDGSAVALSPDGAWLAGVAGPKVLCVWRVDSLERTCVDTEESIEINSLAWAPDSSAVAFSFDAFRLFVDSDLMVYDVADGTLSNVTDDGHDGNMGFGDDTTEAFPVDVMPAWTADSQTLIFSRGIWPIPDTAESTVASVARTGGDVTTLATHRGVPFAIFTPLKVLASGTVMYTIAASDLDEPANGIWQFDPDGTKTQLISGTRDDDFPSPVVTDAWEGDGELRIAALSPILAGQFSTTQPWAFTWSSVTDTIEPLTTPADDPGRHAFAGTLSPDGGTLLTLLTGAQGPALQLTGPANSITDLPEVDEPMSGGPRPTYLAPDWANPTTILVQRTVGDTAYLVTVEPVSGSEATPVAP